jgi:uncharacterized protein YecE (DUF72 family)
MRPAEMLPYYAERFSTVEINNSFWKLPAPSVFQSWAAETPKDYLFAVKAPRLITHIKRLKNVTELLAQFLKTTAVLKKRRGPLLFQLPPNFAKQLPELTAFLKLLPKGTRATFEFRHVSWFDEEVYALLRKHKCAFCIAEDDELQTPFVATTDWGYLRLRRADYKTPALKRILKQIREQDWRETFVFFRHEETASGPRFANKMLELSEQEFAN